MFACIAVYTVFLLTQIDYDFQWRTDSLLLRVALSDSKVIVAVPRGYNR